MTENKSLFYWFIDGEKAIRIDAAILLFVLLCLWCTKYVLFVYKVCVVCVQSMCCLYTKYVLFCVQSMCCLCTTYVLFCVQSMCCLCTKYVLFVYKVCVVCIQSMCCLYTKYVLLCVQLLTRPLHSFAFSCIVFSPSHGCVMSALETLTSL